LGGSLEYEKHTDWRGYPDVYGCRITLAGLALDLKGEKPKDGFAIRTVMLSVNADGEEVTLPVTATGLPDNAERKTDGFDSLVLNTLTAAVKHRRKYVRHPPAKADRVALYEEAQRINADFDSVAAAILLGTCVDEDLSYQV